MLYVSKSELDLLINEIKVKNLKVIPDALKKGYLFTALPFSYCLLILIGMAF